MNKPVSSEIKLRIVKIFVFFKPEYLKVSIWLSSKSLIKNNCPEIRKIKGNISKIIDGEIKKLNISGVKNCTSISLKKSNSLNKLIIKTKLNVTKVEYKKAL
tara:strand:- start:256 stop:561 length:306 start_codon:yes stop_codon:yes gene_type:complete